MQAEWYNLARFLNGFAQGSCPFTVLSDPLAGPDHVLDTGQARGIALAHCSLLPADYCGDQLCPVDTRTNVGVCPDVAAGYDCNAGGTAA